MSTTKTFQGIARFDKNGELVCFCYKREARLCECREKYDCPEAKFQIQIIPGTRPSEQEAGPKKAKIREVDKIIKDVAKSSSKIKQSLQNLEKDIKRHNFKI